MADLRAKRLPNAKEDGQDRYHETRRAAGACRATKNGVETNYQPRAPASSKSQSRILGHLLDLTALQLSSIVRPCTRNRHHA